MYKIRTLGSLIYNTKIYILRIRKSRIAKNRKFLHENHVPRPNFLPKILFFVPVNDIYVEFFFLAHDYFNHANFWTKYQIAYAVTTKLKTFVCSMWLGESRVEFHIRPVTTLKCQKFPRFLRFDLIIANS